MEYHSLARQSLFFEYNSFEGPHFPGFRIAVIRDDQLAAYYDFLRDALEIAGAVSVGIHETVRVDFVADGLLPPFHWGCVCALLRCRGIFLFPAGGDVYG